jgi:hypothetical protein
MTRSAVMAITAWGTFVALVTWGVIRDVAQNRRLSRRAERWNMAMDELEALRPDAPVLPSPADPDAWGVWGWDDPPPVARTLEELEALANVPWPRGKAFR